MYKRTKYHLLLHNLQMERRIQMNIKVILHIQHNIQNY